MKKKAVIYLTALVVAVSAIALARGESSARMSAKACCTSVTEDGGPP